MAASLALVLVGCSISGLPRGAQVVCSGSIIGWEATEDGNVYLAETTTHQVIETANLYKDEDFFFDPDSLNPNSSDPAVLKAAFPVMPSNPKFVLYFLPSHD